MHETHHINPIYILYIYIHIHNHVYINHINVILYEYLIQYQSYPNNPKCTKPQTSYAQWVVGPHASIWLEPLLEDLIGWGSKLPLVGGIPTPLKIMSSSVGMMTFPKYGKRKFMFQNVPNHQPDHNVVKKCIFYIFSFGCSGYIIANYPKHTIYDASILSNTSDHMLLHKFPIIWVCLKVGNR